MVPWCRERRCRRSTTQTCLNCSQTSRTMHGTLHATLLPLLMVAVLVVGFTAAVPFSPSKPPVTAATTTIPITTTATPSAATSKLGTTVAGQDMVGEYESGSNSGATNTPATATTTATTSLGGDDSGGSGMSGSSSINSTGTPAATTTQSTTSTRVTASSTDMTTLAAAANSSSSTTTSTTAVSVPAAVQAFTADARWGLLTLTFTRPIVVDTLNTSQVLLAAGANSNGSEANAIPLSSLDGALVVPDSVPRSSRLKLLLGSTLLAHIKATSIILATRDTTRLVLHTNAARDALGVPVTPIPRKRALLPSHFTPDTEAPRLLDASLASTPQGRLRLTFTAAEPIVASRPCPWSSSETVLTVSTRVGDVAVAASQRAVKQLRPGAAVPTSAVAFEVTSSAAARAVTTFLRSQHQQQQEPHIYVQVPGWLLHDRAGNIIEPNVTSQPTRLSSISVNTEGPSALEGSAVLDLASSSLLVTWVDSDPGFPQSLDGQAPSNATSSSITLFLHIPGAALVAVHVSVATGNIVRDNTTHAHLSWPLPSDVRTALQPAASPFTAVFAIVPAALLSDTLGNPSSNASMETRVIADDVSPSLTDATLDLSSGRVFLVASEPIAVNASATGDDVLPLRISFGAGPGAKHVQVILRDVRVRSGNIHTRRRRRSVLTNGSSSNSSSSSRSSSRRSSSSNHDNNSSSSHKSKEDSSSGSSSVDSVGATPDGGDHHTSADSSIVRRCTVIERERRALVFGTVVSGTLDQEDLATTVASARTYPGQVTTISPAETGLVVDAQGNSLFASAQAVEAGDRELLSTAQLSLAADTAPPTILSSTLVFRRSCPSIVQTAAGHSNSNPGSADAFRISATSSSPVPDIRHAVALDLVFNEGVLLTNTTATASVQLVHANGISSAPEQTLEASDLVVLSSPPRLRFFLSNLADALTSLGVTHTSNVSLRILSQEPLRVEDAFQNALQLTAPLPLVLENVAPAIAKAVVSVDPVSLQTILRIATTEPLLLAPDLASRVLLSVRTSTGSRCLAPATAVLSPAAVGASALAFELRVAEDFVLALLEEELADAFSATQGRAPPVVALHVTAPLHAAGPARGEVAAGATYSASLATMNALARVTSFNLTLTSEGAPTNITIRFTQPLAFESIDASRFALLSGQAPQLSSVAGAAAGATHFSPSKKAPAGTSSASADDVLVFSLSRTTPVMLDAWTLRLHLGPSDQQLLVSSSDIATSPDDTFLGIDDGGARTIYGVPVMSYNGTSAVQAVSVGDSAFNISASSSDSVWSALSIFVVIVIVVLPCVLYAVFTLIYLRWMESANLEADLTMWDSQMRPRSKQRTPLQLSWDATADPYSQHTTPTPKRVVRREDREDTGISMSELDLARASVLLSPSGQRATRNLFPVKEEDETEAANHQQQQRQQRPELTALGNGTHHSSTTSSTSLPPPSRPPWLRPPPVTQVGKMGDESTPGSLEQRLVQSEPGQPMSRDLFMLDEGTSEDGRSDMLGESETAAAPIVGAQELHRQKTLAGVQNVAPFVGEKVIALWDYEASYEDELTFKADESLILVGMSELEDEWVQVLSPTTHMVGLAPKSYLCFPQIYPTAKEKLSRRPTMSRTPSQEDARLDDGQSETRPSSSRAELPAQAQWSTKKTVSTRRAPPPPEVVDRLPASILSPRGREGRATASESVSPPWHQLWLPKSHPTASQSAALDQRQRGRSGASFTSDNGNLAPSSQRPQQQQRWQQQKRGKGVEGVSDTFETMHIPSAADMTSSPLQTHSSVLSQPHFTESWGDIREEIESVPSAYQTVAGTSDL